MNRGMLIFVLGWLALLPLAACAGAVTPAPPAGANQAASQATGPARSEWDALVEAARKAAR